MKIIDAHLHLFQPGKFPAARKDEAGETPRAGALTKEYERLGIESGVVMGNQPLSAGAYQFSPAFHYCIGVGDFERPLAPDAKTLELMELQLAKKACAGIKIYIGYAPIYAGDPCLEPYYRLAEKYDKPVAFHTGMTADSMGSLKYCHPLTIDEPASKFPNVQFVLCHFGNPFLAEAAAVMEKNPNVAADLSGLLDGKTDLDRYFDRQAGYISLLRSWIRYVDDDSRFLFGTDYPATDIGNYIEFIRRLLDREDQNLIFYENAKRIYRLE